MDSYINTSTLRDSTKEVVYVDMDGVLCDWQKATDKALMEYPEQKYPQAKWGFFLKLEEIEDAISSFRTLQTKYDVWILTRPSFKNVNSFTEKAQWILDHFDFDVLERTIMSGDKSLIKGDYLIDDTSGAGQPNFDGEWIHYGSDRFPNWKTIVDYLMIDKK